MAVVKLNEAMLFQMGFDRVAIDALRHLLNQIGSVIGAQTLPDTVIEVATQGMDSPGALVADLASRISAIDEQIESLRSDAAELAELGKIIHGQSIDSAFPPPLTDWEHPGQIGAKTANTGDFTILSTGDGAEAAPSFFFGTDTSTGMYRQGPNNVRYTVSGTWLLDYSPHQLYVNGVIGLNDGTVTAPAIFLAGDVSTGIYRSGSKMWGMSIAGIQLVNYAPGLVSVAGSVLASAQLASSIATGTPPLVVASQTMVPNLYSARAALADYAIQAGSLTSPTTFPAAATDPATTMALVNAIRIAAIAKGL